MDICYADDAAIVAESENDLQKMLYKFHLTAQKYNMKISVDKTKCLTFSKNPVRCKLTIDNKPIEQVMEFKYLGVNLLSFHNLQYEIKEQINKAAAISGCLRTQIWKNKYLRLDVKTRIYKTCVRPIMTYGIETRAETTTTKRMARTLEMKTLRSIVGVTLRDRIRSSIIRDRCDIQDVIRWGRQRRRMWHEHVKRMNNQRLPYKALNGKPTTSRPPGRPPKRWRDSWDSISQERLPA